MLLLTSDRSDHSMSTGEVRPDSRSESRLTHACHGVPEFSSAKSNSGFVASHGGPSLSKEELVWSATWGMSYNHSCCPHFGGITTFCRLGCAATRLAEPS